jgi:cytochrome c biogenesis protein CcdA
MTAGIVFIIAGVLLVLYPPLLSIIVATLLIFIGVLIIAIVRNERKLQRHHQNPTIEFFFRH